MNQPLVETRSNDPATRFETMAERIRHNTDPQKVGTPVFGGAVVIVPPSGDPIEILMLDPHSDIAMFWGTIRSKIDILLATAETEKRRQQGFGGR